MRKPTVSLLLVLSGYLNCAGALPPLTVKDVSLMLRSGYSPAAVAGEISARHFLGSLDATTEKSLTQAGASSDLIETLRANSLSAEQAAAAEQQLAVQNHKRDLEAAQGRDAETRFRVQSTQKGEVVARAVAPSGHVIDALKGDLVTSKNGSLNTFNDQALDKKKLIGLYFSGRWCPSCRKFTPTLVEFYNRVASAHPEFELIFISSDRSAPAMEAYMRDTQMPWPAVRFDKIAEKEAVRKYAGNGIPCLVLIDSDGRVLSDSYDGKTYLGPNKVLTDLDAILASGSNQVAQKH